ncbi:MAG: nucleotidyltransferase domain-containing protein [Candidatus Electryoneaceae bacterium]|nr:nucleotidyltransferase domain-containing protein [Candidatus Electryoneaceae bacterium]
MEKPFEIAETQLSEIVEIIVRTVTPEYIILFGSGARGDYNAHSDVDILIVESEPLDPKWSRRKESAKLRRALREFSVPLDILVHTKAEVDEWQDSLNHVLGRAIREGKMLYERH